MDEEAGSLLKRIQSIEGLEILLLMRRDSFRLWSPDELAREISSSVHATNLRMNQLLNEGLIDRVSGDGGLIGRYKMQDMKTEQLIGSIEASYPTHRVRIIELIYSRDRP